MLAIQFGLALAGTPGPAVPPPHRLAAWNTPLVASAAGTRVAMIVEGLDETPVEIEIFDATAWRTVPTTWQRGRVSVHVADLQAPQRSVRFRSADAARIALVDWDLFTPSAGEPRHEAPAPPPAPGVLPAELAAIGVTSRDDWDADATTCSSTEDDWYRMAIHHTAGSQTYGGTVKGAVQALQAYAMSSGEYCDIPYQFLVGYDGSLWEGRPYDYYSGATGGGNNDGNIAVSFLGCYHPNDCATSNAVTDEMMTNGQRLVQTLAEMHAVPSNEDSIRGHRDWPDNATACPGDWLYARLDELRQPLGPNYAATTNTLDCTPGSGANLAIFEGETGRCSLSLVNSGREDWSQDTTRLAPLPRDVASTLAAATWSSTTRVVGVGAATSPGGVGTFDFDVFGPSVGEHLLSLGLLEEGVIWFGDDGGPADGAITVAVSVGAASDDDTDTETDTDTNDTSALAISSLPGELVPLDVIDGCACGVAPAERGAAGLALAAFGVFLARVRKVGARL